MEKKAWIPSMTCLWTAILLACVSGITPGTGWAFVDTSQTIAGACPSSGSTASSTTDSDSDGFTDYEECNGLTFGTQTNGDYHYTTIQGACVSGTCTSVTTGERLNPIKRNLFVILKRNSPSLIPSDVLSNLLNTYVTGLVVYVKELTADPTGAPDREIVSRANGTYQKAVRITESTDINEDYGTSAWGTPNGDDNAKIFTDHISKRITDECVAYSPTDTNCIDTVGGVGKAAVIKNYIKYVMSHETAHMNKLARSSDLALGGHHYSSSTRGTVMEQGVTSGASQGKWKFYLPTTFSTTNQANDKTDAKLNGL